MAADLTSLSLAAARDGLKAKKFSARELTEAHITAIEAGVGSIMPSYSSWNGVKCSASKRLLTDILKNELGFQGFLISDYNAIDQLAKDYKEAVAISVNAGMDLFPDYLKNRPGHDMAVLRQHY